jgi:hypothetical protein
VDTTDIENSDITFMGADRVEEADMMESKYQAALENSQSYTVSPVFRETKAKAEKGFMLAKTGLGLISEGFSTNDNRLVMSGTLLLVQGKSYMDAAGSDLTMMSMAGIK